MPSAQAILLSAEVEKRITNQKLVEYTNETGSATTIDTDSFYACCDDTLGVFRNKTGVEPDMDNALHIAKLIPGVLYFLMFYKGRDASLLKTFEKSFFAGMHDIANRIYPVLISNSKITQTTQKTGTLPDMDRTLSVFSGGVSRSGSNFIPSETDC